nr:DUF2207 domain-containing protein [uncultured Gellertiella sp.]
MHLPRAVFLALLLLASPLTARAEEVISRFSSDIRVETSGAMEVTETIAVKAEGNRIRHGIFRDFPLNFIDRAGQTVRVDFDLLGVSRDGHSEPYRTETIANGIRIYAGSADTEIDEGPHVYAFHYRTDRQIRYFDDHDELYWNVTGNGWVFPILSVSAHVDLPASIPGGGVTFYTGPMGSREQDARVTALAANRVDIATTRRLDENEGLSIVISQPKGAIAAPGAARSAGWFLRDNLGTIIGTAGLIGLSFYYVRTWSRVGRDLPAGVMVPRWDPPGGLSPALVNYVDNKGFSRQGWTALSASALQLAVRGYVTLEDLDAAIVLKRTDKPAGGTLAKGEDVLLAAVERAGGHFSIDAAHGATVEQTGKQFRAAIESEYRGKYYVFNTGYVIIGVLFSLAVLAALYLLAPVRGDLAGLLGDGPVPRAALLPLLAAGGILLLNVAFYYLMGAPTRTGRELMDGIAGFRTYMTLAEKDRMNMAGAPKMSPAHFETLLPYAVALGVEKPWSDSFQRWLAASVAAGAAGSYQPVWYIGNGFDSNRISHFPGAMAATMASTIPKPQSGSTSGFSGGGSSGGGGGGGGGGGW